HRRHPPGHPRGDPVRHPHAVRRLGQPEERRRDFGARRRGRSAGRRRQPEGRRLLGHRRGLPVSLAADDWRQRAERERRDKALRLRRHAQRRLRRFARASSTEHTPRELTPVILDSERYAAPLAERLGPRDRVQIILWGSLLVVLLLSLLSFFSAPLMDSGLAVSAGVVIAMLVLSYAV